MNQNKVLLTNQVFIFWAKFGLELGLFWSRFGLVNGLDTIERKVMDWSGLGLIDVNIFNKNLV